MTFINLFILFVAALGLPLCVWAFLWLPRAAASLIAERGL